MSLQQDFNAYLADIAFAALDQGLANVATIGAPLVPFLMVDRRGERKIRLFTANGEDNNLDAGREVMRRLPDEVEACALTFDGFVNVEGQRVDTVFVEVHHRNAAEGAMIGQRYCVEPGSASFVPLGKPFLYDGVPTVFD